ncbi:glyoxylate/hydroxypyruvate reductase B-like [Mercenaria mercenaria]|uniref:glyoxylate/hydroxypyruvate reductase B-like n=1 Tax=Mercenaria mercenaria TaxID=6596 RepID=UPI00234EEDF1|nr:glyoxylate/hydroxypyruvate reductase B-like [Mercenaria mercenaria]
MAGEMPLLNIYCATIFQHRQDFLIRNTDYNVIKLQTTKSLREDGSAIFEVPELEDETVASKIEVLFADVPVIAKYRKKLVNLKWAHTSSNGVNFLMDSFEKDEPFPQFTLTKTPGSLNALHTTEYVIGHIIANERQFFQAKESQRKSKWDRAIYASGRSLSSLSIGILGVGKIGQKLAKICKEFGMTVWGLTRRKYTAEDGCPHIDFYRTQERLSDLLENCDYICSILPSTPQTRDMLSGDVLKSCKNKKSVFINVGRGDVVDEQSIVHAINNGWLSGAVLDVFRTEPLPAASRLWSLPGVTVTPHVSGWSLGPSHTENIMRCFMDKIQCYVEGLPLKDVLDWSQGY